MRYVYSLKNLVNGKVYVGQTYDVSKRKAGHFAAARQGNFRPLYQSIRKHGEENFAIETLEECDDSVIDEREKFWILQFDSRNSEKGYNLAPGGKGVSNQTRIKLSEVNKGKNNPMYGRKVSAETRQKTGATWRGKKLPESFRQKLSLAHQNRDQFGEKNPMFGRKGTTHPASKLTQSQTDEIKRRLSNGEKQKTLAIEFKVSRFTISRVGKS